MELLETGPGSNICCSIASNSAANASALRAWLEGGNTLQHLERFELRPGPLHLDLIPAFVDCGGRVAEERVVLSRVVTH